MERLIRPMQAQDIEPCLALWRDVEGIILRDESDSLPQNLRRTRCATALFSASLQAIRHEGITRCHAYVRSRNLTALKFWRSVDAQLRRDINVVTLQIDSQAIPPV